MNVTKRCLYIYTVRTVHSLLNVHLLPTLELLLCIVWHTLESGPTSTLFKKFQKISSNGQLVLDHHPGIFLLWLKISTIAHTGALQMVCGCAAGSQKVIHWRMSALPCWQCSVSKNGWCVVTILEPYQCAMRLARLKIVDGTYTRYSAWYCIHLHGT